MTAIRTDYWRKPGLGADWTAVSVDYEPGHPMGFGMTEEAAIADLEQQQADYDDARVK